MGRVLPYNAKQWEIPLLLDKRKTVTRRICRDGNDYVVPDMSFYNADKRTYAVHNYADKEHEDKLSLAERTCPICPGDILYVRETWCWEPCQDCGMDTEEHNCCEESAKKFFNHDKGEWGCYGYKASLGDNVYPSVDTWHPSIYMPKEAAHIWLKVADVRVERLQEVTGAGILAEGVNNGKSNPAMGKRWENMQRIAFENLWNSTLKKSDLDCYGWDANPWVWVIGFERCEKPESV